MTATKPSPVATAILALSLDAIVESADNPRKHFDPAFITELANSLRTSGQFTPCVVRPHPKLAGKYELAAGATRLRAAREAKLERLDCLVRTLDDAQFLELLTFENLKRRDLQPMEEARSYALLQKRLEGWTVEKIAERSGVSADYVRDRFRLLKLVPAAVELLEAGRIQIGHALELAKIGASQQQAAIKRGLFTREDGQQSMLDEVDKALGHAEDKAVSVNELRAWIDEHVLVDLEHPELEHLHPTTHARVTAARIAKQKIVLISFGYVQPETKRDEKVIGPQSWKRADGNGKHKACDFAVLGVVAAADAARYESFPVCIAKEKCKLHWPEHFKRAEERKAIARGEKVKPKATGAKAAAQRQEDTWAREDAKRKAIEAAQAAEVKRIRSVLPAILDAIAAKVRVLNAKPLLEEALAAAEKQLYGAESKKAAGKVARGTTLEDGIRRWEWLYILEQMRVGSDWGLRQELPGICKRFGVDLKKLLPPEQTAAKAESKKAAPKKTKKKGGKTA